MIIVDSTDFYTTPGTTYTGCCWNDTTGITSTACSTSDPETRPPRVKTYGSVRILTRMDEYGNGYVSTDGEKWEIVFETGPITPVRTFKNYNYPEDDTQRILCEDLTRKENVLSRQPKRFQNKNTEQYYRPAPRSRLWKFRIKHPKKSFSY